MSLFQQSDNSRYTLSDIRRRKADVKRKLHRARLDIQTQKDALLNPRNLVMDAFAGFDIRNIGQYISMARQAYNFASNLVTKIKQRYAKNSCD